jgi:hypothetical protein
LIARTPIRSWFAASDDSCGLIRARLGRGSGFEVARPAASYITLRDVFAALESGDLFTERRSLPSSSGPVGAHILPVLRGGYGARYGGSGGGVIAPEDW